MLPATEYRTTPHSIEMSTGYPEVRLVAPAAAELGTSAPRASAARPRRKPRRSSPVPEPGVYSHGAVSVHEPMFLIASSRPPGRAPRQRARWAGPDGTSPQDV